MIIELNDKYKDLQIWLQDFKKQHNNKVEVLNKNLLSSNNDLLVANDSIDELRSTNMQLMESLTGLKNECNSLKLKYELSNDTFNNEIYLFSLSNGCRPIIYEETDVGLYEKIGS